MRYFSFSRALGGFRDFAEFSWKTSKQRPTCIYLKTLLTLSVAVSHVQERALAVTLAYLIYDLFCCLFDKRVSLDNTVHHLVSIIGIGAGLLYGKVTDGLLLLVVSLLVHLSEWSKALLAVALSVGVKS